MDSTDSDDGAIREEEPPLHGEGRSAGEAKSPRRPTWRTSHYEAAAWVIALIGVVLFGFGIFPCVNPIQWDSNFGPDYLLASMISLVASIGVLWIAWRLSREGQRLKHEEKERP